MAQKRSPQISDPYRTLMINDTVSVGLSWLHFFCCDKMSLGEKKKKQLREKGLILARNSRFPVHYYMKGSVAGT